MNEPALLLPADYAHRIVDSGKDRGTLDIKWSDPELLGVVDGFSIGTGDRHIAGLSDFPKGHFMASTSTVPGMGIWFRVEAELHLARDQARRQTGALALEYFKSLVMNGAWINPRRHGITLALTYVDLGDGEQDWAGWLLTSGQAQWCYAELVDENAELLAPLRPAWPLAELSSLHATVIGVGSIGGAASEALAGYGLRHLALVDPDRLLGPNFARHRAHSSQIGRHKTAAIAEQLRRRDSGLDVDEYPVDVIWEADVVRPLLDKTDIVIVSTDGVDSRRAANHLVRRAGKPAVFACVLGDGAFGELVRSVPPRTGCLLCTRARMIEESGIANPEPSLDRRYGTGTRHLPMTAVGTDLGVVGELAAKAAVATLLEDRGYREQRLPGDHAVIGLRPKPGFAAPFDIEHSCELRWREVPPPRPDCLTCRTA
jgi:molybdopterin/thiamine biosynthesis adenylyltransferase